MNLKVENQSKGDKDHDKKENQNKRSSIPGTQRIKTKGTIGEEYGLSGSSVGRLLKMNDLIDADGSYETITSDFRKYPCIEDSIADHSADLLGAKNGSKLRYDGLKGCTDYKKAVQIIKDGGYATSLTYVEKTEDWNRMD